MENETNKLMINVNVKPATIIDLNLFILSLGFLSDASSTKYNEYTTNVAIKPIKNITKPIKDPETLSYCSVLKNKEYKVVSII